MNSLYRFESEIEAVVRGFELCQTPKDEFPHQSHLTVAVWYLRRLTFDQATERMRSGLYRFLDHHGIGRQKYHETLTIFWMKVISRFMKELDPELSLLEVTNNVLERLADSHLPNDYFSPVRRNSAEARVRWLEPDLKQL